MKVKIAFAVVTVAALGVVIAQGVSNPGPTQCQVEASQVPPYSVTFEDGSGVTMPSGHEQMVDGVPCDRVVSQWDDDRRFAGYVDLGQ